jgi:uncharacterized protein
MIDIGQINRMRSLRQTSVGMFLGNEEGDEILLPMKYIPTEFQVDDELDVFVYLDSEDRPIATTLVPKAMRGDFVYLKVKEQTSIGAFLDWGLEKDLLIPYREQGASIEAGRRVLVHVYLDETTNRMAASTRVNKFLNKETDSLEEGLQVKILVTNPTELGYNVIIDNEYQGLLYSNELFQRVNTGDKLDAFISKVRADGKVDVRIQASGIPALEGNAKKVLDILTEAGGSIPVGDKTHPQEVYSVFEMSKKNFKKAAGALFKSKLIKISSNSIDLLASK